MGCHPLSRLPLLNLPESVLNILREGKIEYTKARVIARVKDNEKRDLLLKEAVDTNLSLTQIKERIKEIAPTSSTSSEPTVRDRLILISRKIKRGLDDPQKQKKLENLLQDLEFLVKD